MMTGIGVHHGSESVFTFGRNERSGWSGIRSEVLFVGNQLNTDVRGGVKYGIATVWLSSPSHRSDNDEQTEDVAPTYTISTLHELPALVARLLR
jgi:FMN phosphatase YigB (HAD superfamily)